MCDQCEGDPRSIQGLVDAVNHVGEQFRILANGPVEPELVGGLNAPYQDYVHTHEPWDRSFVIWWDRSPARVVSEALDMFITTPAPNQTAEERPNVYAEKSGGMRGLIPSFLYERRGDTSASVKLTPQPIEGDDHLFRLVSENNEPVPDLILQTWDHGVEQPAIDAERHFERNDRVQISETGEEGTVESVIGRTVAINLDRTEEYDLKQYRPSEVEAVDDQDQLQDTLESEGNAE